jgi:diketogulonate reductase-like aldo/keto reductase
MLGRMIRFLFTRLVPLLVLMLAVLLGWVGTFPNPEGTLFSMVYPILKGRIPPVISGGFKDCPVEPLPADLQLDPRPAKETFVRLPGYVDHAPLPDSEDNNYSENNNVETKMDENLVPFLMPQQGIGMCCRYTAYDPESVRRTILWYLKVGGRHIDTADLYLNHEWIGEALQIAMKEYKIPRQEIWVTTKVWPRDYGTNATMAAIPRMLQELQLDYIDLILMHAPSHHTSFLGSKSDCAKRGLTPQACREETWRALSVARNEKKWVRHAGVSNFNVRQLQELQALNNKGDLAPIANNQFQYNPWVPDHAQETFEYCQSHGISVTAWSSFAGTAMQHMAAFTVSTLQKAASNHHTTVAQVLLKWAMQKGAIVIPGTANPKHMKENLQAFELTLTDQEMADIDALRNDESAKGFFNAPVDET